MRSVADRTQGKRQVIARKTHKRAAVLMAVCLTSFTAAQNDSIVAATLGSDKPAVFNVAERGYKLGLWHPSNYAGSGFYKKTYEWYSRDNCDRKWCPEGTPSSHYSGPDSHGKPTLIVWDHALEFHQFGKEFPNERSIKKLERHLKEGRDVKLNLEFMGPSQSMTKKQYDDGNLLEIRHGEYDREIESYAKALKHMLEDNSIDPERIAIRTLHEFNGNWYRWSIGYNHKGVYKNSTTDFKHAFDHVRKRFESVFGNDRIKWQLNFNRTDVLVDSPDKGSTWDEYMPEKVDHILITAYNRYSLDKQKEWRDFGSMVHSPYHRLINEIPADLPVGGDRQFSELPFGLSETSSMPCVTHYRTADSATNDPEHTCDPAMKGAWFRNIKEELTNYPRIQEITFFFENKFMLGKCGIYEWRVWDLNSCLGCGDSPDAETKEEDWKLQAVDGTGKILWDKEGKHFKADMTAAIADRWRNRIYQNVDLRKGYHYQVSIRVRLGPKANPGQIVHVVAEKNSDKTDDWGAPYEKYLDEPVEVKSEMYELHRFEFSMPFTPECESVSKEVSIQLMLGDADDELHIDDFEVKALKPTAGEGPDMLGFRDGWKKLKGLESD